MNFLNIGLTVAFLEDVNMLNERMFIVWVMFKLETLRRICYGVVDLGGGRACFRLCSYLCYAAFNITILVRNAGRRLGGTIDGRVMMLTRNNSACHTKHCHVLLRAADHLLDKAQWQ